MAMGFFDPSRKQDKEVARSNKKGAACVQYSHQRGKDIPMKTRSLPGPGLRQHLIFALFVMLLILLIPGGDMLADSNAPTVTNTPEPTDTPTPEPPTQTPQAAATDTPIPIPTETENPGAAIFATQPPSGNGTRLSTLDRILLVILAFAVVIVIGVIVYIFINQARGGLGER
jgi:hypothetical protein